MESLEVAVISRGNADGTNQSGVIARVGCVKKGLCHFPEQAKVTELAIANKLLKAGGLKTPKRGTETPETTGSQVLLMGTQGGQLDLDGGMTPWFGVGGIMPISLEVQSTIKRAEHWAYTMALCIRYFV